MSAVAYTRCSECHSPIPLTITSDPVRRPDEPITLVVDETDVWAHAWIHEEQAEREG